jgi:hypothetical protein
MYLKENKETIKLKWENHFREKKLQKQKITNNFFFDFDLEMKSVIIYLLM